jgi:hypothetical protein
MAERFKLWLQVETIDDEAGKYENEGHPMALGSFPTVREAEERMYLLGALFPDSDIADNEIADLIGYLGERGAA